MKFLCLSDLHGHADALNTVLISAKIRGFSRLLVAGDLCFPGPAPLETWYRLMEHNATCTQGLADRAIATLDLDKIATTNPFEQERIERVRQMRTDLGQLITARLGNLPVMVRIPLENGDEMLLVHGSPSDPTEGMSHEMSDAELLALVADDPADIIVCGSTHVPFHRQVGDIQIVNVGSVGEAPDSSHANATLIEVRASGISVEQFSVPITKAA
jgi:predicted phosphodiesterase